MARVILRDVRLAFADIYTPTRYQGKGDPKFGASFIIKPENPCLKDVEAAIAQVCQAEWGSNWQNIITAIKDNPQKYCFGSGDKRISTNTGEIYDGFEGNFYLNAKSNASTPPIIHDGEGQLVQEGTSGAPYPGCYVNAQVDIWAQKGENQGLRCQLQGIRFLRDGDSFGGGRAATEDEMADLGDGADAPQMQAAGSSLV